MSMCQGDLARKDEGPPLTKRMEVAQAAAKPRKGGEGVGKENVVFDAAARRYRTWVCMSGWSCIVFARQLPPTPAAARPAAGRHFPRVRGNGIFLGGARNTQKLKQNHSTSI